MEEEPLYTQTYIYIYLYIRLLVHRVAKGLSNFCIFFHRLRGLLVSQKLRLQLSKWLNRRLFDVRHLNNVQTEIRTHNVGPIGRCLYRVNLSAGIALLA